MVSNTALWQTNPILYLIQEKYPASALYFSSPNNKNLETLASTQAIADAKLFRNELITKSATELSNLVEEAKARESEKIRLAFEKKEASAFFNQAHVSANFEYWSKMSYWTIDEAIALSLGKEPQIVTWSKVQSYLDYSPFIAKYTANRELVMRAKVMGQLWDSTIPNIFVLWAERMRFEMPSELVSNVKSLGVQVADWKTEFEKQSETVAAIQKQLDIANETILDDRNQQLIYLKENGADYEALAKGYREIIAKKDDYISQLVSKIRDLEGLNAKKPKGQRPELTPRERESLLQLVIGMAIKGYSYDPNAIRTNSVKEIADDLRLAGLSLDEDTVRRYLNEGKVLFSDKLNRTE